MPDRFADRCIVSPQVQDDQHDTSEHHAHIHAQFFILEYTLYLTQHQHIVAAEINTEQEHEHRTHILQIGTVTGDAIIFNTESTGSGSTKGRADRIEQRHSSGEQEYDI